MATLRRPAYVISLATYLLGQPRRFNDRRGASPEKHGAFGAAQSTPRILKLSGDRYHTRERS